MRPSPTSRTTLLAGLALLACSFDATGLGDEVGGATPNPTSVTANETGLADSTGQPATTTSTTSDDTGGSGSASAETGPSDPTDPPSTCGNGDLDPGEPCDGGPNNESGLACTPQCEINVCGDSYVGDGEDCDPGPAPQNGLDCTPACTSNICGDGYLGVDEVCDDGEGNGADKSCTDACQVAKCGDMKVGPGETCDDGNLNNNDACLNTCLMATCGDGILNEGAENCDIGPQNGVYGSTCNALCTGPGPKCGDNVWDKMDEQCDGNDGPEEVTCDGNCKLTCVDKHGNCNGNLADGCEEGLDYSDNHCGKCNMPCMGFLNVCVFGKCSG